MTNRNNELLSIYEQRKTDNEDYLYVMLKYSSDEASQCVSINHQIMYDSDTLTTVYIDEFFEITV
jgi:hypothetical protein